MSTLLGWRAWYANGIRYSAADPAHFTALPAEGVVVVVTYHDTGKTLWTGADWYWFDGRTMRTVLSVAWGATQPRPPGCVDCIKRGVEVSDATFAAMVQSAQESAWRS